MIIPSGEKIIETKKCLLSGQEFYVTDKDLEFYDKISPVFGGKKYSIPTPTLCPEERQRRRLAFRNERKLYKRKCDKTGKEIISIYSPDKPYVVYDQKVWWSDEWSAFDYVRKFDFEKGFFEQFDTLLHATPLIGSTGKNLENSDYTLHSSDLRNCYMTVSSIGGENLFFSYQANGAKNCVDCSFANDSEYCYECIDTHKSYKTFFSQDCDTCRDCIFCYDCKNCSNCLFCFNLRGKQYCINNTQHTPESYAKELEKISLSQHLQLLKQKYVSVYQHTLHRAEHGIKNEDCIGDYINSCSHCFDLYNYAEGENLRFTSTGRGARNCYDCNYTTASWCLECLSPFPANNVLWSQFPWDSSSGEYLSHCYGTDNCFGCSSLKKSHHCILNTPYSVQEYETLCGKIIDHMRSTGEWGEFFPHELSPFGYNETVAQEYFPMTEAEVRAQGWNWYTEEEKKFAGSAYSPLPISQYDERVVGFDTATRNINECLNGIIQCEVTKKPFKIIKQELAFYIENGIPIPTKHPDQRHKERMELRNPRTLYERVCTECGKNIITTYAPERPEKVVCEECYRKLVY